MSAEKILFGRAADSLVSSLLREHAEWGLSTYDLVNPPRRFWADITPHLPVVESGIDANRVQLLPTPSDLMSALPPGDTWAAQSKRSLARLQAHFLICEDPQRRMDAREVDTLAHQVSLVRHILDNVHLRRILIADEVGLGKTVEVGLLIKELIEQKASLRILYLAPARLVSNVRREFERLGLHFRQWSSADGDARLTDHRIIASIQRAVHGNNYEKVLGTQPWDIIVVDECHHLSAWSADGGDPTEAFSLVRELINRQPAEGRVIFLSGTPHQGHGTRFENLVGLLRRPNEPLSSLSGRVIYRTKDDIRDWFGNPLFPRRQVNEPTVVDLGPHYRSWIEHIRDYYKPSPHGGNRSEARQRAAGWRCAQALQWAASSPQAGLGYLVRQALRAHWTIDDSLLQEAIKALRPYRLGDPDESTESLFLRIRKEVERHGLDEELEDIEDDLDLADGQAGSRAGVKNLIAEGLDIISRSRDEKWQVLKNSILDEAGDEKVVLFAQPVETVTALAHFLERMTGKKPAMILGGQSDAERQKEIERFRHPEGSQFLVSSRAGGEGINLQFARRLVHIDVPWNPMDLEQRVGRVHRFGSRKPIIIDTLIVKDSREADAYRIARQKLQIIASTLVEAERFEAMFSRVMCLVPPEDLQDVLLNSPQSPINMEDQEQIAQIVQQGFSTWREFHERFGKQQELIHQQDPGLVTWDDVASFAQAHAEAKVVENFTLQRFQINGTQIEAFEEKAAVLNIKEQHYSCGDYGGAPIYGPSGESARQLGLNIAPIAEALRKLAFPPTQTGAAYLRWQPEAPLPACVTGSPFGIAVLMRQTLQADQQSGWVERGLSLHCFLCEVDGDPVAVGREDKGLLIRGILRATIRNKPESDHPIIENMKKVLPIVTHSLRRPSEDELEARIRHAVTPLFAGMITVK